MRVPFGGSFKDSFSGRDSELYRTPIRELEVFVGTCCVGSSVVGFGGLEDQGFGGLGP